MTLEEQKKIAREEYALAMNTYLNHPTPENWRKFCDSKITCRRLGVII